MTIDADLSTTDEPDEPHVHKHVAAPPVRDVIAAALVQRLPCPECGSIETCRCIKPPEQQRIDDRVMLIHQALVQFGYLPDVDAGPAPFDPEDAAEWLAGRSGFPRYTQVAEGWRRLIESPHDVELAASYAQKRVANDEVDMVKAARAALLAWHDQRV